MAKGFNAAALRALRAGDEIADAAQPGLWAVRYQNGSTAFVYRFRDLGAGKLRQMTIGDAPIMAVAEARAEVERLQRVRTSGDDPRKAMQDACDERVKAAVDEAAQGVYTVADLVADYHRDKLAATKRGGERKRTLDVDLARWTDKPVASIKRLDVQRLIDGIAARGAADTAGRVLRELRRALEHAVQIHRGLDCVKAAHALALNPRTQHHHAA